MTFIKRKRNKIGSINKQIMLTNKKGVDIQRQKICPECYGKIIYDSRLSYNICSGCGLMISLEYEERYLKNVRRID